MQSSQVTATNGNAITWHTTYQWQGGNVITSIPIQHLHFSDTIF